MTESGELLMTRDEILGGQQVGSIWGHGAYQAPDWSADWLHRESLALLGLLSVERYGEPHESLDVARRAGLEAELRAEIRENRLDPETDTLVVSELRARAMRESAVHYRALFGGDPRLSTLREDYALRDRSIDDPERLERLTDFFFWTSWACVTERPGETYSYTNNWPHDPLVGNRPTSANFMWSMASIVLLLLGIGALIWMHASSKQDEDEPDAPASDPLMRFQLTPSMRAVA